MAGSSPRDGLSLLACVVVGTTALVMISRSSPGRCSRLCAQQRSLLAGALAILLTHRPDLHGAAAAYRLKKTPPHLHMKCRTSPTGFRSVQEDG